MFGFRFSWYLRLLAAIWGGALCLALGYFTLIDRIPADRQLRQNFTFDLSDTQLYEQSWQWNWFVQQQQLEIKKLAYTIDALMGNSIVVQGDRSSRQISILLTDSFQETLDDEFDKLVQAYKIYRQSAEQTDPETIVIQSPDESPLIPTLKHWLVDQQQAMTRLQQDLYVLQSDQANYDAIRITLKNQLRKTPPPLYSKEYHAFYQEQLNKQYQDDDHIQEVQQQLVSLKEELDQLDTQAGQTDSSEELEQLDQQREQSNKKKYRLEESLKEYKAILSDEMKKGVWDDFLNHIRARLRTLETELNQNSDKQLALRRKMYDLQNKINLISSFMPDGQPDISQPVEDIAEPLTPDETAIAMLSQAQSQQYAPLLKLPASAIEVHYKASMMQYFIMGFLICIGAGLGLLISSNRRVGHDSATDYYEDADSDHYYHDDQAEDSFDPFEEVYYPEGERSDVRYEEEDFKDDEPTESDLPKKPRQIQDDSRPNQDEVDVLFGNVKPKRTPPKKEDLPGNVWSGPYDRSAEIIEKLRQDNPCPIILISSVKPDHCSPRVSVNLAISLAKRSLRVLIIEMNPGSSDLAEIFDVPVEPGCGHWLKDDIPLDDVLNKTPLDQLAFMTAGGLDDIIGHGFFDQSKLIDVLSRLVDSNGSSESPIPLFDAILLHSPAAMIDIAPEIQTSSLGWLFDWADGLFLAVPTLRNVSSIMRRTKSQLITRKTRLMGVITHK